MRVFLTGATGYVGSQIVSDLLNAGHKVNALIRPESESKLDISNPFLHPVLGDALEPESFSAGIRDCDAVIHLIAILREFPYKGITYKKYIVETAKHTLALARKHGIQRYLFMSALGTKPDAESGYFDAKHRAELLVRESGLAYTIFRPSLIFGSGDEFVNYFAGMMRKFHLYPIVGAGRYRMQPISLYDVSRVFVESLTTPETERKVFELAGPDRYAYSHMMERIRDIQGSFALPVHVPKFILLPMAAILQYLPFFPITKDQIIMLYDENITGDTRIYDILGFEPQQFEPGIAEFLA